MIIDNNEEYVACFYKSIEKIMKFQKSDRLQEYVNYQTKQIGQLVDSISTKNFWQLIPKILGIDAKLSLILELIIFDDFSDEDIIRITESDYSTYFKELCGYSLNTETVPSIFFNLL